MTRTRRRARAAGGIVASLLVMTAPAWGANDKLGPAGYGPNHAIPSQQPLTYSIRFENLASATAPAQQVVIQDPLDASKVVPATMTLGAISFGSFQVTPPPGLTSYSTQVDLRPTRNLLVDIDAALDLGTNTLSWFFQSIDPATGQPPVDPMNGFLPPNVTPPEGEGSVVFTVTPRPGLADGTQIHNNAAISFDGSPPIVTADWVNTIALPPDAQSIVPPTGGNSGRETVVVVGHRLQNGASIRLLGSGQPTIVATDVVAAADRRSLTGTFALAGAAAGPRDVVVINPDAQSDTISGGFTITAVLAPQLRAYVIGPATIRADVRYPYDLVIENPGNVDALDVPLWLTGIPSDSVFLDFPLAYPPQAGGEPVWSASTVPLLFSSPNGRYLTVVIPRVPPGTTIRRVYLEAPAGPPFKLRAAVTPPWADGAVFRGCLVNGGITAPLCMGAQLTAVHAFLAASPSIQALSGIGVWAKVAWNCESAMPLAAALNKAEQVLDFMVGPVETQAGGLAACSDVLPPRWRDSLVVTLVSSYDPNDKLGSRDTISAQQPIPYSIRFDNDSVLGSAPALRVTISDPLNTTWFDPATVSLDAITFGNVRIVPPPGLTNYTTRVDLRPGRNLLVDVNVSLEPLSHTLQWFFTSLDTFGNPLPPNSLGGFLPPNVHPPEGEGSVLFTVLPQAGLTTGTRIHNGATIDFDNSTRNTPDWYNTVDNTVPASHVVQGEAQSSQASIPVTWVPEAVYPDLRDYTIYVVEDGAPARVWRLNTTAVNDTLKPPGNHVPHSYAFYSVARDIAGNIEAAPAGGADATVQSKLAVDGGAAPALVLAGARPNPSSGPLHVWFALPSREPATLDLLDIAGRRLLRREVGALGPGSHMVAIESPSFHPGLYFLRLTQGARSLNSRVVMVR